MSGNAQKGSGYREYVAWDAPTRWFHWVNALAVLGLIATGVAILTGGPLGLSPEGKITLKSVHVIFGYVMAVNLLWRFVWAFFGNRYARWRAILPHKAQRSIAIVMDWKCARSCSIAAKAVPGFRNINLPASVS